MFVTEVSVLDAAGRIEQKADCGTFLLEICELANNSFAGTPNDQILGQMFVTEVSVLEAAGLAFVDPHTKAWSPGRILTTSLLL